MTVAPPVPPPVPENGGFNDHVHVNSMPPLPRFHPIAMTPNPNLHHHHHHQQPQQPMHPDAAIMHSSHFRPFPVQDSSHPPPIHTPGAIDHIESRLRQLECEEAARMAARSHLLAIRKREDEEFRRVTENAEAEEEDLRRQRKRLKRESMGLGYNAAAMVDSPPLRPTQPQARRLSETNAATTLAFFKQQSPHDFRPLPPPTPAPAAAPPAPAPATSSSHLPPPLPHPHQSTPQDASAGGFIRRKQKYTIKNVEAWGERHGRPAAHGPSGRALWKRPSDGNLVYLTCPVPGCGKADFVTLHGFMCHLTKKHKDRSLGSQSRALEICGVVYQPGEPVEMRGVKRASTEESRVEGEGGQMDQDQDMEDDDEEFGDDEGVEDGVKMEEEEDGEEEEGREGEEMRNITKQSISAIIDNGPVQEKEHEHEKEQEQEHQSSGYPGHHERDTGSQSEKENTEPKDMR